MLITGGAGFIGGHCVQHFLRKYKNLCIVNLDKVTYAANLRALASVAGHPRYRFVKGDITDQELVTELLKRYDIRGIMHLAAESHVDNAIENPTLFARTNTMGTAVLLEAARQRWMKGPYNAKSGYEDCVFHHVSTDEVFGSISAGGFTENSPYAPNSPYSASKAGADMLVRSYYQTYGMNVRVTNCSNNFGPYQHHEKLIPTVIRCALSHRKIPIYGNGSQVRDWLFVSDHCAALDLVYHKAEPGSYYNIGGNNTVTNLTLVRKICDILDRMFPSESLKSYHELISFVDDRPGHDQRYAIDASKIKSELEFYPASSFDLAMEMTVGWYIEQHRRAKGQVSLREKVE